MLDYYCRKGSGDMRFEITTLARAQDWTGLLGEHDYTRTVFVDYSIHNDVSVDVPPGGGSYHGKVELSDLSRASILYDDRSDRSIDRNTPRMYLQLSFQLRRSF